MEKPIMLKIEKIVDECDNVKTFYFAHKLDAKPGQFVILWIPRLDEKPMSISYQDEKMFGVTVLKVGEFTEKLHEMKQGELIGVRGAYGNWFELNGKIGKKIAIVGGGCGCAPTAFLADEAKKQGFEVNMILAGKSKNNIMFEKRMKELGVDLHIATDDGSLGKKGFATDVLKELMENEKIDTIYTCGPEIMMKKIFEIVENKNSNSENANGENKDNVKIDDKQVYMECSLERHMKCGFGICGQCCLDPTGERVCKEGPVFDMDRLRKITEFGKYHRNGTGKKVDL